MEVLQLRETCVYCRANIYVLALIDYRKDRKRLGFE